MIGVYIGIVLLGVACVVAAVRMFLGPKEADRAIAADLLLFGSVGLIALFGVLGASRFTFDVVLIAALVGFLGSLSLARALTRGRR